MSEIKDFIKFGIDNDINMAKRDIRQIKKHIRSLEDLKSTIDSKTEKEIKEFISSDPDSLKMYEDYSKMIEEKQRSEIKKMVKEGKLKEIYYGKDGKPIDIDTGEQVSGDSELPSAAE